MKDKILTLIHTDARFVKGCTSLSMQRCFAIKADINELLDVSRQIYCELIGDMKGECTDRSTNVSNSASRRTRARKETLITLRIYLC